MDFRILGPLEVVAGPRTIPIRPGNDRALLALLLLHANEPVTSDRLIDELWACDPPPTASKMLQSSISRLRRELGPERIETRDHAYLFHLSPDELDASRFELLVREGRQREALALWRGQPLTELDDQPLAAAAARRLDELRVDALQQRIDEDTRTKGGGAVTAELESLLVQFPFRERLYAQLMQALYADGRQKEALEVYQRARRVLRDDLGLEPGPELQELERAILRQDPALPRPPAARARRHRRLRLLVACAAVLAVATVAAVTLTRSTAPVVVSAGSVVAIDPSDNRIVGSTALGAGANPGELAADSRGVWVTNGSQDTLVRLDPASRKVVKAYDVGGTAADVALDAAGGVWVVTGTDDTLVRIDSRTDGLTSTPLPPTPAGSYSVATGAGAVWVGSAALLKIDPRSLRIVGRANGPACCVPVDVTFGGGAVWVAERLEDVVKLGPSSLAPIARQDIGQNDLRVAFAGDSLWTAGSGDFGNGPPSVLWQLDGLTARPRHEQALGTQTHTRRWTTTIATGEGSVWVAIADDDAVFRVDPHSGTVVRIPTGRPPYGVAVGGGLVWVSVR